MRSRAIVFVAFVLVAVPILGTHARHQRALRAFRQAPPAHGPLDGLAR